MTSEYMYSPAILHPLIPLLSSTDYGSLLSTCTEIRNNFDLQNEWKRRSPNTTIYHKKHAFIKDKIKRYNAITLLKETTNKENLTILLRSFRILKIPDLDNIYYAYLHSDDPHRIPYYNTIRMERIRWGTANGSKIKPSRKRKAHKTEHSPHRLIRRLTMDTSNRRCF